MLELNVTLDELSRASDVHEARLCRHGNGLEPAQQRNTHETTDRH